MLREQVRDHIVQLTDQALAEYLAAGADMYEPEAIAFATVEWERRSIEPRIAESLQHEMERRVAASGARAAKVADEPLELIFRLHAFWRGAAIPFGVLHLAISDAGYRRRGEVRKAKEMWKFGFYGFLTMVLVLIIVLCVAGKSSRSSPHQHNPGTLSGPPADFPRELVP